MKQEWIVRRRTTKQKDGQRRWDLVYQCLLSWAQEWEAKSAQNHQEVRHESSYLRAGFDPQTERNTDD